MISEKRRRTLMKRHPQLTEGEKIRFNGGGMGHKYLRLNQKRFRFAAMKRKGGKARKEQS